MFAGILRHSIGDFWGNWALSNINSSHQTWLKNMHMIHRCIFRSSSISPWWCLTNFLKCTLMFHKGQGALCVWIQLGKGVLEREVKRSVNFSLSSFTFIKSLFSSSLYAIWVVSSAYLILLIFLPAILLPACASSSPAFLIMYSAYNLNKQGDNIQPWHTPFPVWSQSVVPCPVITAASWLACRFLKRQVKWWYSHLFQNFPECIVIHTVKGFGIVNKEEIDVFLELCCLFDDPADVGSFYRWFLYRWFLCLF